MSGGFSLGFDWCDQADYKKRSSLSKTLAANCLLKCTHRVSNIRKRKEQMRKSKPAEII